ncbi:MAG TPA: sigma-70 family RNA polymerase sigma factor [Isosphaeraceae bacterium]|jgi:RNA polymerase sigma-70 factor (ECF subfamily)
MWPDSDSTRELLDRLARADDPAAADRLWARHREPLRRMIDMRLDHAIGRRVDASDVVQDVLIEASRRLSDYLRNPAMPFHLWLRQIARDRMIDQHRRHRVAARRSLDRERSLAAPEYADRSGFDLAAGLRDGALTPAAASLRRELEGRFRMALDAMDEDDREILLMRHFEGLSNSEAAGALGLSEPAAGMRHLRALRRLRERLGEAPSASGF